ncbi:DUF2334 domain-containing protein [Desulfurobacterium atlanticum]|uniref:DUF2334 domain-containing protein n=1 Tax=Desulfurobacterium atlanticum TaxID=240169 RepID=A0A238ZGG2_9BACT|nr:DUF2334 domain-containing protein [Desulfurobacterium atlanticum]SNR82219.1 hypothetical protein SAMN06265340_10857 [Desulfurobacterium atlanticum]
MEFFNVSIHDVTKSSLSKVKRIKELLMEEGIEKITYLLIPNYHRGETITEIKEEIQELVSNGEPVLHGYTHKGKEYFKLSPMKLFTSNEGEFISFSEEELKKRLRKGKKILEEIGIRPKGFIPPAWLIKKSTIKTLKEEGFEFATNRYFVFNLKNEQKQFSPVVTFSCREPIQWLSKELFLLQTDLYARFLKAVRIAIHPCDIDNTEKVNLIKKAINDLKAVGQEKFLNEIAKGGQND